MQPMTVTEIASAVKGVWWNPSEQVPVVSAVSTDSRRIVPGSLFLPWVGGSSTATSSSTRRWTPAPQVACAPSYPRISGRISFTSR